MTFHYTDDDGIHNFKITENSRRETPTCVSNETIQNTILTWAQKKSKWRSKKDKLSNIYMNIFTSIYHNPVSKNIRTTKVIKIREQLYEQGEEKEKRSVH